MLTVEAQLIKRAQNGDEAALVDLYQQNQPSVFTYVYYRVGCQELAEDLTSEVFTRMVEKLSGYVPNGRPILAWLYTIARNLIIDHSRRAANQMEDAPLKEWLAGDENSQTDRAAEIHLRQECLQHTLQQLTEEQQQVIQLKFIENRSNADVGEILGKTEGAVKSLQHRALAAMARILEQERCYEPDI